MSEAAPHLRRAKAEFENRGIRNEVQITEHVAFLLLPQVRDRWDEIRVRGGVNIESLLREIQDGLGDEYASLEQIPQPPPVRQWSLETLNELLTHLQNAFDASPHNDSWGNFFQREIRFELLKGSSGSQYPTPHQVAELMAVLALTGLSVADIFDPTAGSSGLLAACRAYPHATGLTGCDFDPQWAGIGSANLILHGAENARYHVGSALGYARPYAAHFNSVVMNPPFGGSRSAGEVADTIGTRYGRSNATVLTALALNVLQPGGIMAVLVPSGILFGGGGEAHLRTELMRECLEAIITLPENTFQPYSQVAAHLLVARKSEPADTVWFCKLAQDGYPAGAGRDLTGEPNPTQNELPRARDLILQTRQGDWQTHLVLDNGGEIQTVYLGEAAALPGVGVRMTGTTSEVECRVIHLASGALVRLADETEQRLGWLYAPYTADSVQARSVEQAQAFTWEDLLSAQTWTDDLVSKWQGSNDDVSLTITQTDERNLTLKRARTEFVFTAGGQQPGRACLLNEQGEPLTPWLRITEEKRQNDLVDNQFGEDFGAMAIEDAQGIHAGWLLNVQATAIEDEEVGEESAFLLIVSAEQANLYPGDGNGDGAIVLLERGWLRLAPQEPTKFLLETGVPVKLRQNVRVSGFAIGPVPDDSEGVTYSLFGVLVPRSEFVDEDGTVGDLRPERFLPEPEAAPLAHPMDVLARIRKSQTKLTARVDSLLQTLGQAAHHEEAATAMANAPAWLTEMLSTEQRRFWEVLHQQQVDGRPRHFNILDAAAWCQEADFPYSEAEIAQQLQLLLRLGLVQSVHTQGHNLYRLITVGDLVAVEEPAS